MTFLDHKYGYVKDGKVFLKSYRDYSEREIGEVRESEEKSLHYFLDKFELAEKKVNEVVDAVRNAQNKGSYLMKLIHMREYIVDYKAIGDFAKLLDLLDEVEEDLRSVINDNRSKNFSQKKDIIEKARLLQDSVEWKETSEKLKELQKRWVKVGRADTKDEKHLNEEFKTVIEHFFNRRNDFYESKKLVFEDRLAQYRKLIDTAKQLVAETDIEKASAQFNELHVAWKKVGPVQRDKLTELWNEFKGHSDNFYKTYNQRKKAPKAKKHFNNEESIIQEKKRLLQEARDLLQNNVEDAIPQAIELQKQFKKLGFSSKYKTGEISDQFWLTCDYIFETNYLTKVLNKKYPEFDSKEVREQARLKKVTLKELIVRDQNELDLFEENAQKFSFGKGKNKVNNVIDARYRNQKRKLIAKKMILERLDHEIG